jgi:hypothetical protein
VEGILVHYASISHVPICFWRAVFERKAKSEIVADLTQLEQQMILLMTLFLQN